MDTLNKKDRNVFNLIILTSPQKKRTIQRYLYPQKGFNTTVPIAHGMGAGVTGLIFGHRRHLHFFSTLYPWSLVQFLGSVGTCTFSPPSFRVPKSIQIVPTIRASLIKAT